MKTNGRDFDIDWSQNAKKIMFGVLKSENVYDVQSTRKKENGNGENSSVLIYIYIFIS